MNIQSLDYKINESLSKLPGNVLTECSNEYQVTKDLNALSAKLTQELGFRVVAESDGNSITLKKLMFG